MLLLLDNYEEALKNFDKAIELDQNQGWYYKYKGFSEYRLGNYNESIKVFNKIIEKDLNDYTSYEFREDVITFWIIMRRH